MVWFLASVIFYWCIVYLIIGAWRKITQKWFTFFSQNNFIEYFQDFLYRIASLIVVLSVLLGSFTYYQNEINPAKMPVYTLSNGEKTLIFQAMSHIWSQNFYASVKQNIANSKKDGYVYYFEWVKWWTKENEADFDKALWVQFDADLYDTMSKLYWLVAQDNREFLWLVNEKDKNIDIWIDEIMSHYNQIKQEKNIERTYNTPLPASKMLTEELAKLSEKELRVLRYINQAMINMIMKSDGVQSTLMNNFANKELFDVILNKRNEVLAREIITSPDTKIITTYGLLHFTWVLKLLQAHDIKWQITKIDYIPVTK